MELKPGYKQTEEGIIPNDWEVKALGSIGSVIRGSSPRPKADKRFYGGNVPRLMVEDVTRDRKFVTPSIDFLTPEGAKRSRPCKRGTLTVVCSGTPAVVGLPSFLAVDACIHDGMLALTNLAPTVDPDYLFHRLTSRQEQLYAAATHGGTFVNLTTTGFGAFTIALPPTTEEQRALAGVLSDVDALIGAMDQLLAKKRDLKQAAMQQLLTGQSRLPGFSGEWSTYTFAELFDLLRNASNSRADLVADGEIGYIHYGDIHTHGSQFFDCGRDLRTFISADKVRSTPLMTDGDLVMVDASEDTEAIGKAVEITGLNGRGAVAGLHTLLLRAKGGRLADGFKGYLQNFSSVREALVRMATGVSVYGISKSNVRTISLAVPDIDEQKAIAAVLSDMDAELAALEQRLAKTRDLKQGMMQELLTGRTRLV